MTDKQVTNPEPSEDSALPFVAPCRELSLDAPLRWLACGWWDFRQAPGPSLILGLLLTLLSAIITWGTWVYGTLALYIGLATGFVFVGPVLAIGFYTISRQLEMSRPVSLGTCLGTGWARLRELLVVGAVLLVVLLVWARAATMVYIFFPSETGGGWESLLPFLGIGSAVGALFAWIVFSASAVSLPMLVDRKADSITAVVTSVNAVLRNKGPMLIWGCIIFVAVVVGFATALLGFVVLLPVIGHASWHAYRESVDGSAWPLQDSC
jgi:uncharacterized membrane protein